MQHLQKPRGEGTSVLSSQPENRQSRTSAILSSPEGPLLETAKSVLLILSALFPIVNPLGGSPVFLALTHEYPASARTILPRRVAINSFVLLIPSFLLASNVFAFFVISIPVLPFWCALIVISH